MKNAGRSFWERIRELDRSVREGEYPNARTLARRLEVGHRTVQRDVEFLRDRLLAPLEFDWRRNGYFYKEANFRLSAVALTEGELVALCLGCQALRQYEGTPYAEALTHALRKIAASLTDRITVDFSDLDRALSFRITAAAGFDPAIFRQLTGAVRAGRRLRIGYQTASRGGAATTRRIDPYHLTNVNGSWYLVAYCHSRHEVRMFATWRIRELEETGEEFEIPGTFSVDAYLERSFGVLRGKDGEQHRVVLRFTGTAARYVGEQTWHLKPTREPSLEGELILSFVAGHLRELERFALSWGGECEVLEPLELRRKMAETAALVAEHHAGPPASSRRKPDRRRGAAPGEGVDHADD